MVAVLSLTSCMKSNGDGNSITMKRYCYNRVVKAGAQQPSFDLVTCEYLLNFDKSVASFTFWGVTLGDGEKSDITVENISFRQTEKGYQFSSISEMIPVIVNGVKSNDWFMQGFSGTWEMLGDYNASSEFFQLDFTISANNVLYNVQSNMVVFTFLNCVNNITDEEGVIKGFKEGTYTVSFDPVKKKSTLLINNARLSLDKSLSVDNWKLNNIPTNPTYNGFEFIANPDSVFVPKQNSYDVPNVNINVVSGNLYLPAKSLTMRLMVNGVQVDVRAYMSDDL